MKTVVILGLTGSIGTTALRGIASFRDSIRVVGASVHTSVEKAARLCIENGIENLCITSDAPEPPVQGIRYFRNLEQMLCCLHADVVLNGIAGSAGLEASVATVISGSDLALANKETVVLGGRLFLDTARGCDVNVIPVDSEHSALDQLINDCGRDMVEKLVITASGGPFLNTPYEELVKVSPRRAAKHPTWNMGPKISIDSSTLANKGLEVIEAHYLFGFGADDIEVVIHPQSIVHSMIRSKSGQVYAQMSPPDMVFPIMRALTDCRPDRSAGKKLDFDLLDLNFRKLNTAQFPFVADAFECVRLGGAYSIAYNAADEAAVKFFMDGRIKYTDIHAVVRSVLDYDWSEGPAELSAIPLLEKLAWERAGGAL